MISLFLGVSDLSPLTLLSGHASALELLVLVKSRIPRLLALLLAGSGLAVSGALMQMIARNRFVEPSTTGTVESASLGMLCALILFPGLAVMGKMLIAAGFALAGTGIFFLMLRRIPLHSTIMVPLIGLMLAGIINALAQFLAYRYDLTQSLATWNNGDFSAILAGRYELLWASFFLTLLAYFAADRFTLIGMGEAFAANLGVSYRSMIFLGLAIVALVTASVIVTAGAIPFVGLIIPNMVSLIMGDRLRQSLPWLALSGAGLVLICDMIGRTINAPYEVPVGSILGVVGGLFFLILLVRKQQHDH